MSTDKRKRQKYAVRSCLGCRKRKVKCKLNNVEIPSSLEPVQEEDACERCKKMGIDCIVWDGERKSKRYTIESTSIANQNNRSITPTTTTVRRPESSVIDREQILTPFYPFKPTFESNQDGNKLDKSSTVDRSGNNKVQSTLGKARLLGILRRPILMMTQILERQDKFRCGIPPSISASGNNLNDFDCSYLSKAAYNVYDLGLIIQHPHLPRIRDLYALYKSSPNPSRKLLLCSMLFLCQSTSPSTSKSEIVSLQRIVSQLALQTVLTAPRSLEAAQALELIGIHCPFLFVSGEGKDERRLTSQEDGSTAGSVMIALAIKILLSLGFEPKEDAKDIENVLWTSLCSWELALSFHDQYPIKPRQMQLHNFRDLTESANFDQSDKEIDCVGKITRAIGCRALYFRSRVILESGKCELENEALLQNSKDEKEMKARQIFTLESYQSIMKDEELDRCWGLNKIKGDLQSKKIIAQKAGPYANFIVTLCNFVWLWLDLEAIGLHYIQLFKALGNIHSFILRKEENNLSEVENNEESNSIFRFDFRQRILDHPEWKEHVGKFGGLRNKMILSFLSRSCQLSHRIQDIQLELEDIFPQEETFCRAFVPVPLLSAILVNGTKGLLDTQIFILQAWNRVHEDTDMYMVIIRQAAEILNDERIDVRLVDPIKGKFEVGVGQCCADILRIIADTMSDWQNKQKLVLANHCKEKQKIRNAALQQQQQSETRNYLNANLEPIPIVFDSIMTEQQQIYEDSIDESPFSNTPPVIFDQLPTLNNLLEGMLEIPDLNDFLASMNHQQASFSFG